MEQKLQTTTEPPEGLIDRPATMDDVPQLVDLVNAQAQHLFGENEDTVPSWQGAWLSPGLDLARDTRVLLDANGLILATTELWSQPPHVSKYIYWRVRLDHEDPAYGQWALQWAEQRARQDIHLAPADARVVISSRIAETDAFSQASMRARGYQPVRRMDRMRISLREPFAAPENPPGIQVRSLQNEPDLNSCLFALWESFEDHWGHSPEPFESFAARSRSFFHNDPSMDPSICLLALEDGQPAGGALCRQDANGEAGLGWINMLGVRRAWRKRGLGKALLLHAFTRLRSIGMDRAGLDVDSESLTGALRLYEAAGLRTVRSTVTMRKELRPGKDLTVQNLPEPVSQE